MANEVNNPFPLFLDIDGSPLEDGYIYIGEAGLDPETNTKQVYWDSALSDPVTQPLRTKSGFPVNGTIPSRVYVDGQYSILIQNKREADITAYVDAFIIEAAIASAIAITDAGGYFTSGNVEGALQEAGSSISALSSASAITITDAGDYFTSSNVEGALQEVGLAINNLEDVLNVQTATLSTTQAVSVPTKSRAYQIQADTSAGSITLTLDDGNEVGQKVDIECSGSGLCYVKGTGVYDGVSALGTPISDGLVIRLTWNGSEWKPVNEVTANYESGDFVIKQSSDGDILQSETASAISSVSQSNLFGSSSGTSYRSLTTTVTYPVSFDSETDIEITHGVNITAETTSIYYSIAINTTTTSGYKRFVVSRSQDTTIYINVKSRGKY